MARWWATSNTGPQFVVNRRAGVIVQRHSHRPTLSANAVTFPYDVGRMHLRGACGVRPSGVSVHAARLTTCTLHAHTPMARALSQRSPLRYTPTRRLRHSPASLSRTRRRHWASHATGTPDILIYSRCAVNPSLRAKRATPCVINISSMAVQYMRKWRRAQNCAFGMLHMTNVGPPCTTANMLSHATH